MTEDETTGPADTSNEPKKEDISHILEEVRLPERREFHAGADAPKSPVPEPAILKERVVQTSAKQPEAASATKQNGDLVSSVVVPVRTLKDDLQNVVRDQKISLVHAVSLEEEKKKGQEHLTPEQTEVRNRASRRTKGILFFSGLFLVVGIIAIVSVIYVMQEQQAVPPVPQASILFAEQTVTLSLNNESVQGLKTELSQARSENLGSLGSITRVVPTITATSSDGAVQTQPATLAQFFSALGIDDVPQELMGAIGPDFFFGFHVVDTNAPLFVIPVTSYDHAFAGMLAWEPTMDPDLSPIFTSVSMTSNVSGVPAQRVFQDAVMRNYDVRELVDDSGNIVLYYSFPTPNLLVIAESPYSFTEILSRLQAEREL